MQRLSLWLAAGLAALAVVGLVSGCGGGGDDSQTAASTAQGEFAKVFVKRGNEICHIARDRQKLVMGLAIEHGEIGGTTSKAEQHERLVVTIADPYVTMMTEFEELPVAPKERAWKLQLLQAFNQRLEELEADPKSAGSAESPSGTIQLAAEYGLSKCAI